MFSQKELNLEEHQLREQVRQLSAQERAFYDQLELPRLRQADTYLRLNLLFPLGVQHLYLQRWGRALLSQLLTLFTILSFTGFNPWGHQALLGLMLIVAMILIELPQLINARLLVQSRNIRVMQHSLSEVRRQWPEGRPRPASHNTSRPAAE